MSKKKFNYRLQSTDTCASCTHCKDKLEDYGYVCNIHDEEIDLEFVCDLYE